jgi:ATP-dependent protease ClpP protease subunit
LAIAAIESDLQSIMRENPSFEKRKELIAQIENKLSSDLGKKVAVAAYIANTMNPGIAAVTSMSLTHLAYVDDLIRTASGDSMDAVALIIETFGGEATFPSEVMQRARRYCKNFYVVVVNVAKSAGTLLSIISDKIIALETASFGPVDPQMVANSPAGPQTFSARQIKELIEVTLPTYVKNLSPPERAAILASQNYAIYQQALDGLKLVKEVLDSELSKRLKPEEISRVKEKLVDIPLSHSLNVSCDDLEALGFDVKKIKASNDLGKMLLEYHRRCLKNLLTETGGGQGVILFESRKASFQINAQVQQSPVIQRTPQIPQPHRKPSAAPPSTPSPPSPPQPTPEALQGT